MLLPNSITAGMKAIVHCLVIAVSRNIQLLDPQSGWQVINCCLVYGYSVSNNTIVILATKIYRAVKIYGSFDNRQRAGQSILELF